jgi:hypothetical protein
LLVEAVVDLTIVTQLEVVVVLEVLMLVLEIQ